jgi:hypothetical protein
VLGLGLGFRVGLKRLRLEVRRVRLDGDRVVGLGLGLHG